MSDSGFLGSHRTGVEFMEFVHKLRPGFCVLRINQDTFHRTDIHALLGFEMADALGAAGPVYFVDLLTHVDRLIWAFGFAYIAVDAIFVNNKCHN